jgi:peptidoglycan hydrolase CwlO-like protein
MMEGIALYETLERKIDELLTHTRQFQESQRQLEGQLQEKERLFQQQAILIEQLKAERDEVRKRVERLIAHIEEKVEDQRKATR